MMTAYHRQLNILIYLIVGLLLSGITRAQEATPASVINISIESIAWSPDGSKIATRMSSGSLWLWNTETQTPSVKIAGHGSEIADFAWSPDSRKLITGGWDAVVNIWDVLNGNKLTSFNEFGVINSVDWSQDGKYLAASRGEVDGYTIIWDAATYQPVSRVFSDTYKAILSPAADKIALARVAGIGLFDVSTGDYLFNLPGDGNAPKYGTLTVKWTSDGNILIGFDTDNTIKVWDVTTGQLRYLFTDPSFAETWFLSSYLDTMGNKLTVIREDGSLNTWDLATGELILVQQITEPLGTAAFSPYGGRLAYTLKNGEAALINISVPTPSITQIADIATACTGSDLSITQPVKLLEMDMVRQLTLEQLPDFVTQLEALPTGTIPPVCAADLIAVAEALIE